ncbi:MAG: DNA gyrase subunit A [Candidatus Marsarchaeota archaeon]|nr:DNA gyrase subunit A [Candidatus Marsarchaeota archaeon]
MAEDIEVAIENEMQSSYIDYAMSVIIGRALPDARDGLKPAQRRILYAMYMLGNTHDKPTKKSARVVGEVIGKYHPHGDIAAYETLARMAQDFSMNHLLVEGQGNMGDIDGDPPAAQRYTEVRLRGMAEDMLLDLDKKAVPMMPNFDNTEEEPVVLPSKVPNLLVNGASGIAVGVATNILPHNLGEVCDAINAYVANRDITSSDLLSYVKGPDFPTGGIAFYNNALESAYTTGRGLVVIRARTSIEKEGKSQRIIITEIPYTVNKAMMLERIAELARNKTISGIGNVRDESDKSGIRVVVDVRHDASPDYVLNQLYMHTQMQTSMPVMNIAVIGNRLLTLNLRDMIRVFVDHRFSVIKNRSQYDLGVARDRLHIVEGLVKAIASIDTVVALIRKSRDVKDARAALMERVGMSEKQANAVLDMRLSRLTSLENATLVKEQDDLGKTIEYLNKVLADESMVYRIIKDETSEIKKRYARARRTTIEQGDDEAGAVAREDLIKDEPSTIILTKGDYLKRIRTEEYRLQGRGGRGVITIDLREGDFVRQVVGCMAKDYLLAISDKGRAYWLKAYEVPEGNRYSSGKPAVNLIRLEEGEHIARIVNTRVFTGKFLVFITRNGKIKRVKAELFSRPRSNGIKAIPLLQGDTLADVALSDGGNELFIATKGGFALRFEEKTLRPMSRVAHGVRGMRVRQGDTVVNIAPVRHDSDVLTVTGNGFGKITQADRYRLQGRGGRGVINLRVTEKTGEVVRVMPANKYDKLLVVNSLGVSIDIPIDSIRVTGRGAQGVRIMRLQNGAKVVDARVIEGGTEGTQASGA